MRRAAVGLLVAVLATTAVAGAAERHALLIGIGDYTGGVTDLEGPPHDLDALEALLRDGWGFAPDRIVVLRDGAATREAILANLDRLQTSTSPGDFIFIYYSGHGTSAFELTDIGLDGNTGALVPADLDLDAEDLHGELIVGSRDLRPRLERLDRDRQVFAAFDACYSGAAVRSLRAVGQPRYVSLSTRSLDDLFGEEQTEFGERTATTEPYPYDNLLYVSAAARHEAARDVTTRDIRARRATTVDGRPHGAFTNALLAGLQGAADTNGNGELSYGELYDFLRNEVSERFPQQPQLLLPERDAARLRNLPVLGVSEAPQAPAAPTTSGGPLRLALDAIGEGLRARLDEQPGVALVAPDTGHDLLLAREEGAYRLYHGSGDVLASLGNDAGAALDRVAREVRVRRLIDLTFTSQPFNVTVAIPGNRGFLTPEDGFSIEVRAERESHLLLVSIDNAGGVSVLYPFEPEELEATGSVSIGAPDELRVEPPFGTDYLKVFAFEQRPPGVEHWMGVDFSPLDPELERLLDLVTAAPGDKAQGRLKVVTRESLR